MKYDNSTIKVGDIFVASWGYEQTNLNFFQVVKKVGKQSVRVQEVKVPTTETFLSTTSENMTANVEPHTMYPTYRQSTFIENHEKGDTKKVCVSGFAEPHLNFDGTYAKLYQGQKLYHSWGA